MGELPTIDKHRERFGSTDRLPKEGRDRKAILAEMEEISAPETERWRRGYASGTVFHGGEEQNEFLNRVYALHSQSNPLHFDLWPSAIKFEAEIVAMTARMLGAEEGGAEICGSVSAGGTESIALAVKAYRDYARAVRDITEPEIVLPSTAHPAFDKAAHNFCVEAVRVPIGGDGRADVAATEQAITPNTIAVVGSAPGFPHGLIDPIDELSELARERGVGFHTDACLGAFVLPWAERLGYNVPAFDFRLPGVTSISADTHKYGYAPKGSSVVLYRNRELLHHQYFTATDWSGGLYASPGFAGSRPGGLVAATWAAMVATGENGYLEAGRAILETASRIKEGIGTIPGLGVVGDPLFLVAFRSEELDVYRVYDAMAARGWYVIALQRPAALHLMVTLRHTQEGVADRFLEDLRASVAHVREHPRETGGRAPIYGMANAIPDRGMVRDVMIGVMDDWYRIP
jgi:glutamate/tyrosine decarboxylase-like PLP-dependent enzyme